MNFALQKQYKTIFDGSFEEFLWAKGYDGDKIEDISPAPLKIPRI